MAQQTANLMKEEEARVRLLQIFSTRESSIRPRLYVVENETAVLGICQEHPTLALEYYTIPIVVRKAYPEGENSNGEAYVTPLEDLIRCRASLEAIQEFCEAHPKALEMESKFEVIKELRYRVHVPIKRGGLPLHLVCSNRVDLVEFMAAKYPQAVSVKDNDNLLPLNRLINSGRDRQHTRYVPSVEALVAIFPEGLRMPTKENPRHWYDRPSSFGDEPSDKLNALECVHELPENVRTKILACLAHYL